MRRALASLGLSLLLALPASNGAIAQEPRLDVVTIAIGAAPGALPYLHFELAKALGLFEDEGIDARFDYYLGGADAAAALISGNADFAGGATDHVLAATNRGVDLKVVAGLTTLPGVTLVVRSDLLGMVAHPADLRALRVGITSPGSATDQLLTLILKRSGLSRADVEIAAVGTEGMRNALASGHVDAAMGLDPWTDDVVKGGLAFVLVDLTTEADTSAWLGVPYAFVGALTSQQTITERPEVVQRVVNTLVHTCAVLNHSNPAGVTAMLPREVVGEDASAYAASVGHYWAALSKDCKVSVEGVSNFLSAQAESGAIPGASEADPSSLFDMTFVNRVHVNLRG